MPIYIDFHLLLGYCIILLSIHVSISLPPQQAQLDRDYLRRPLHFVQHGQVSHSRLYLQSIILHQAEAH